ncbi:unnamed protein product [Lampetra fluviatilis]
MRGEEGGDVDSTERRRDGLFGSFAKSRNEGFMAAFVPLSGTPQTPRPASKRPRTTGRCVDSRDPTTLCRVQQPWQTRPKVNLDTAGLVSTHRRPRSRAEASPTQ